MKLIPNRHPGYDDVRTNITIKYCDIPCKSIVLDIGEPNGLSRKMAIEKDITIINTISDLDKDIKLSENYYNFKYVTCFEVIEHLINPGLFLDNLHQITDESVIMYLSSPRRPKYLWNNEDHFHEYDKLRFNYLLNKTNWKIIWEKKIYYHVKINGIRPIIRNLLPQTVLYKIMKI